MHKVKVPFSPRVIKEKSPWDDVVIVIGEKRDTVIHVEEPLRSKE